MSEATTRQSAPADYSAPDRMLRDDQASVALGMQVVEMREGFAVVTMMVREDMLNGFGIAHGGMVFSLADSAFAMACNENGSVTVSSGAEITFLASCYAGDELTATARLRSKRGRSGVYDVEVRTAAGIVAEFRGHSRRVSRPAPPEVAI